MSTAKRTYFIVALFVLLFAGNARGNNIEPFEAPARQSAIRILEALKPLEAFVEQTDVRVEQPVVTRETVEITGSRVNLRAAPSVKSAVTGVAVKGDQFTHLSTDQGWRQLLDGNDTLYVSSDFSVIRRHTSEPAATVRTTDRLRPGSEDRVRDVLNSIGRDYKRLGLLTEEAETRYDERFGDIPSSQPNAERDRARESLDKIQKYRRLVSRHYDRLSELAGGVPPPSMAEPAWRPQFSGTVEGGYGTNTAESKQAGATLSETDVSRSQVAANINADLSPNDRINMQFGRTEEIRFAPSSQLRARGAYTRTFTDRARLTAHAGLSNYRNQADDSGDLDRTEFGVQGVMTPSPAFRATGGLAVTSTAYPNDDARDVGDTRLELGAGGRLGESVQWNTAYRHIAQSFDDASLVDNTQGRFEGALIFETGAQSAIVLDGHLESHSFDQSADPREYARHELRLASRSRSLGNAQTEFSLGWRGKDYKSDDDRDFTEFRGAFRSREYSPQTDRETRFLLNYRNYAGDMNVALLDYLEGRFESRRDRGRERSAGLFSEGDLYVQYFFENNGIERNALVTQYVWLGVSAGQNTVFRIGPHLATNTELVVIDGAVDPNGEELGTFESPDNTFRYGAKAELRTRERPLRARASARYEMLDYYNRDGAPTLTRLQLEGQGTYALTNQLDASASIKFYTSGSDDANALEMSETDLLFGLIYHLGARGR